MEREKVLRIYHSEGSVRELAKEYGTSVRAVSDIKNGKQYQRITQNKYIEEYSIGDALDYLRGFPRGLVRGVVTSPPYNKGLTGRDKEGSNWKASLYDGYSDYTDDMPYKDYVAWQRAIIKESIRIVGDAGLVAYNHKYKIKDLQEDRLEDIVGGFPVRQTIIWSRSGDLNQGGVEPTILPPTYEVIFLIAGRNWVVPKGIRDEARKWGAVWYISQVSDKDHPATFPEELAIRCIKLCGGAVVDPFAGSGTVGLAAKKLGVAAFLNDISADYKKVYQERCQQQVLF